MHSAIRAAAEPAPHPPGAPWSLADLAGFAGLSLSTLERLVRSGELESFKVRRRRLVPDAAARRLVAGSAPAPVPASRP